MHLCRLREQQGHEEAKEAAIKLLATRPHSQKELRTKLLEKGFGMELIKDALERLQELVRRAEISIIPSQQVSGDLLGQGRYAGMVTCSFC